VPVRPGAPTEFDVIVVGAGAAGSVVARSLADAGRSVALLEAGPDLRTDPPAALRDGWALPTLAMLPDWSFETEPDADGSTKRLRRGRLIGGTSWLTRFAVRGAPADFDGWAARGNPGWGYVDVLPSFRRIESDAEYGSEPWHGEDGPVPITRYPGIEPSDIHAAAIRGLEGIGFAPVADHNAPSAVGVGRMPFSSVDGRRVTSTDAYLPLDAALPTLTIRAEAQVASVVVGAGRARGVRLVDGTEIRSQEVVLAAGVYGSPTILMRSGVGPAAHLRDLGIPVLADLPGVGSNLADHPAVSVATGWAGTASGARLHTLTTMRSSRARSDEAPDVAIWIADPAGDDPGFEIDALLMKPDSRGTVRLRSPDPTAPPRISLPVVSEVRDIDRLVEAYRMCHEVANRPEIRRLVSGSAPVAPTADEDLRRTVLAESYSVPHVVGTCRMGPGDDGDVVDATARVHGVEGLSVIDASIIPEPTAGFPHLVTIMLGDRLGRLMAEAPGLIRRGRAS
jgi:choline dehydrogenase